MTRPSEPARSRIKEATHKTKKKRSSSIEGAARVIPPEGGRDMKDELHFSVKRSSPFRTVLGGDVCCSVCFPGTFLLYVGCVFLAGRHYAICFCFVLFSAGLPILTRISFLFVRAHHSCRTRTCQRFICTSCTLNVMSC